MLVTVTFDVTTKDQKKVLEAGLYVDIEIKDEEYELIGASCDTCKYAGIYEDEALSDICDRCLEAISDWGFEEALGEDILFRFDYPLETRIDRAETVWGAGYDEAADGGLIPPDAELLKNNDGTFTVWWPGESA